MLDNNSAALFFSSLPQHLAARYGEKVKIQDVSEEKDSQPWVQWGTPPPPHSLKKNTIYTPGNFFRLSNELKMMFFNVSDVWVGIAIKYTFF